MCNFNVKYLMIVKNKFKFFWEAADENIFKKINCLKNKKFSFYRTVFKSLIFIENFLNIFL